MNAANQSEKPSGTFGGRKFNMSSSLPKSEFKKPDIPPVNQKSSKVRSQRVILDNAKFEMGDAQSVATIKTVDLTTTKNIAENLKVRIFLFINKFVFSFL